MRHAYPVTRTLVGGYPSTVGNLSAFSPMREEPQPSKAVAPTHSVKKPEPAPTYRVRPSESVEALFKLGEAVETGDFTDAFLED